MKSRIFTLLLLLVGCATPIVAQSKASQKREVLKLEKLTTTGKEEFYGVSLSEENEKIARIMHRDGITKVPWEVLPEEVRKKFGYDEESIKKRQQERERAKNDTETLKRLHDKAKRDKLIKELETLDKIGQEKKVLGKLDDQRLVNFLDSTLKLLNTYVDVADSNLLIGNKIFDPFVVILLALGKPDTDYKLAGQKRYTWWDAVNNPLTEKMNRMTFVEETYTSTSYHIVSQFSLEFENGTKHVLATYVHPE